MAKSNREIIGLVCQDCKSQNYVTRRNKVNEEGEKVVLKKYCKRCRKHTSHKETVKLK